jgi:5S rRNA maturation endonuclease (ribonuclease M5)
MVPVKGRDAEPVRVIPLAKDRWTEVKGKRFGAVEEYGLARGLDPAFLREMDVVDMAKDAVGFGYRDADSGEPCRIKARGLTKKSYWIEPRAREGESGIAKSPLYLAHELALSATWDSVVIVEGEVDALTLRFFGIPAVVSLPDGAGSANRVDLSPVWYRTSLVLSATDADAEGDRAHRDLFARVTGMGKQIARVRWVGRDGTGFKDANDALVLGQFEREDFERCLSAAAAAIFALPAEFADAS